MEVLRLENIWEIKLKNNNWSAQAYTIFQKFIAQSTLEQYNSYLNKYKIFCINTYGVFPPEVALREASVADFLLELCNMSKRPQSLIKMSWAAVTHYYDALEFNIRNKDLKNYMSALIKDKTLCPQGRTPIPPLKPIINMFKTWNSNEELTIEDLRLKCVCLLCLTAMCRPSDIAPKIGFFRRQIIFNEDKSATILFFGIKNDSNRKGFEIVLTPSNEPKIDPVQTLKCYLQRTCVNEVTDGDTPVFRSLTSQTDGISAATVAKILKTGLERAGLADEYTARSFRAAGATAAVRAGIQPDAARQIGRWRNRDVFFDHYVYTTEKSITDKIMTFDKN